METEEPDSEPVATVRTNLAALHSGLLVKFQRLLDMLAVSLVGAERVDDVAYEGFSKFFDLVAAQGQRLPRQAAVKESEGWYLRNVFRDAIEYTNAFLEECRMVCAIFRVVVNGRLTGEDYNRITGPEAQSFHLLGLPHKIEKLRSEFLVASDLEPHVLSINRVRACLVHRLGRVTDKDADGGELVLRWRVFEPYVRSPDGSGDRVLDAPGMTVEAGEELRLRRVDKTRAFKVGEQVEVSYGEFTQTLSTLIAFATGLVHSIEEYARQRGIVHAAANEERPNPAQQTTAQRQAAPGPESLGATNDSGVILVRLQDQIDGILARITESHLSRYDRLQSRLASTNVAIDAEYRSTFNGYYRMQRRSKDWYDYFFALLEAKKNSPIATFEDILTEVYRTKRRIEASFCSKLLATIQPDKPVYDKHVRESLRLDIPKATDPADRRLRGFVNMYARLEQQVGLLIQLQSFQALKEAFDRAFPAYKHFSEVKKLDLLLWQYRQDSPRLEPGPAVNRSPGPRRDSGEGRADTMRLEVKMPDPAEVFKNALSLDVQDRAALAQRLLASLEELSEEEAEYLWAEEAQRRLDHYRAGRAKAIPAEEVAKKAESLFR